MRRYSLIALILAPLALYASLDPDHDAVKKRIAPVGKVTVEEQTTTTATSAPVQEPIARGQTIYEQHCILCHRDGIAGAPKFRDKEAWKTLVANRNLDALVASAIQGKNVMPPKGTCQECSDSDIKAAITYMMKQP